MTGPRLEDILPIVVGGSGHVSLTHLEAFSAHSAVLTTQAMSENFLLITSTEKLTASLIGCRLMNHRAERPITRRHEKAKDRCDGLHGGWADERVGSRTQASEPCVQGFTSFTPEWAKSATFRVTRLAPSNRYTAAICESTAGMAVPASSRPGAQPAHS